MKKKDILCTVDFSDSSIDALKWAFDYAKRTQAKVTVMYCYRLIALMDDEETSGLKRNKEEEATKMFKEFETKHLNGQPVTYKFITEVGFFHFRIEMFLQKNPIGLLVMGNSTVQKFDEYKAIGFDKFLMNSKVPVVIVPQGYEEPIQI